MKLHDDISDSSQHYYDHCNNMFKSLDYFKISEIELFAIFSNLPLTLLRCVSNLASCRVTLTRCASTTS